MKIVILGANGLIGSSVFNYLSKNTQYEILGTVRSSNLFPLFEASALDRLASGIDVTDIRGIDNFLGKIEPNIVINCAGLTKHRSEGGDPSQAIAVNALFPHQLNSFCKTHNARLIHISSDCVFLGSRGCYVESDIPDADDLYGRTKALGEISGSNAITIRTSTIGHELNSNYGLLNWFLNQNNECQGFKKAYFSGLPTVELARVIAEYVIPAPHLNGLYHLAGDSISKFDLLKLIATQYGKRIQVIPEGQFSIDRSLNGEKFQDATGYKAPDWPTLIKMMHQSHQGSRYV